MNIDEEIKLLNIERNCVRHADVCNRECDKCELVQDTDELLEMYDDVVKNLEKLKEYETLEEQGMLIKLPCKAGDDIYIVKKYGVEEAHVTGISEADDVDYFCFKVYMDPDYEEIVALEDFNKTWFLTESEAEAKWKELRGEENDG